MTGARQIYQETLDHMTTAVLARDTATFAEHIDYPYEVRVMDGSVICNDSADVARVVNNFADQLEESNVTDLTRTCDSARFITSDHILGHHTTRVMSGAQDVISPYVTRLELYQSRDGHWRVSLSDTVLSSTDWDAIPRWASKTTGNAFGKPVSENEQRLKLFQSILDRISAALLSGDVEAWLNASSLPFQVVTRQDPKIFTTEQEMRDDFERYQSDFKTHGVADIIREALTADLVNSDQMVGTFRTHVLNRANHIVPPWEASMTLHRQNGIWRAASLLRAIGHLNWSAQSRADIEDIPQDTPKKGDHQ